MKPFDIELAKQGYPVCTRNGKNVRIICFDRKEDTSARKTSIIALINRSEKEEEVGYYHNDGTYAGSGGISNYDLFMKSEKHEVWTWCYPYDSTKCPVGWFSTKERAEQNPIKEDGYVLIKLE